MKRWLTMTLFLLAAVGSAHAGGAAGGKTGATGQATALQERMQEDSGIMALIATLQNDPDMQSLLDDPGIMNAIASGDLDALIRNPRFMKILDKPQVREIEKRLAK